jgi:hypothetical protein
MALDLLCLVHTALQLAIQKLPNVPFSFQAAFKEQKPRASDEAHLVFEM